MLLLLFESSLLLEKHFETNTPCYNAATLSNVRPCMLNLSLNRKRRAVIVNFFVFSQRWRRAAAPGNGRKLCRCYRKYGTEAFSRTLSLSTPLWMPWQGTVVVPIYIYICSACMCRPEYRHYIGNRHYSTYCRYWLFPFVPSDFTALLRATSTT